MRENYGYMTVAQLIEQLQRHDGDKLVLVRLPYHLASPTLLREETNEKMDDEKMECVTLLCEEWEDVGPKIKASEL